MHTICIAVTTADGTFLDGFEVESNLPLPDCGASKTTELFDAWINHEGQFSCVFEEEFYAELQALEQEVGKDPELEAVSLLAQHLFLPRQETNQQDVIYTENMYEMLDALALAAFDLLQVPCDDIVLHVECHQDSIFRQFSRDSVNPYREYILARPVKSQPRSREPVHLSS